MKERKREKIVRYEIKPIFSSISSPLECQGDSSKRQLFADSTKSLLVKHEKMLVL